MGYLTYKERQELENMFDLLVYSFPTGHTISFPLPTKRWEWPAYASFASPITVLPDIAPQEQWLPDIWWLLDARSGEPLIYTRWKIFPFADNSKWTKVTLAHTDESIDNYRTRRELLEKQLDQVIPYFFKNEPCHKQLREQALTQLLQFIDVSLLEQYRLLAPDFFTWLEMSDVLI